MNWRNSTERYGALSIGLHWLMLLLFVALYGCAELNDLFPKGSYLREAIKTWHYLLGLCIFFLAWFRLALNSAGATPRIVPEPPRWQHRLARLVHAALYVLMLVTPVIGWMILSAKGKPIMLFSLQLPALIGESKGLAEFFKEIHEFAGNVGYFLIAVHSAAALYHHYAMRDNTLRRMLPSRK